MHITLDISYIKFPKGSVEETLMIMIFSGKTVLLACSIMVFGSLHVPESGWTSQWPSPFARTSVVLSLFSVPVGRQGTECREVSIFPIEQNWDFPSKMKRLNALGLSDFCLENAQIGFLIFSIGCGVGLEAARKKTSVRLVTRKPETWFCNEKARLKSHPLLVFYKLKRVASPFISWWLADLSDFKSCLEAWYAGPLTPLLQKKGGVACTCIHTHSYIQTCITHTHTYRNTRTHTHTHTLVRKSGHLFAVFSVVSKRISGFCFIATNQLWMKK